MRLKHPPRPIDEFLATAKRDGLPIALETFDLPASPSLGDFTLPRATQIFAAANDVKVLCGERIEDTYTIPIVVSAPETQALNLPPQFAIVFTLRGEHVDQVAFEDTWPANIPQAVETFVRRINNADVEAVAGSFCPGALLNDELTEYWCHDQIREWAAESVARTSLTLYARRVVVGPNTVVLLAEVDGTFDKRGLPHPLLLSFYFTLHEGGIAQLIILRNVSNL